jgi:hypothetical protein
LAKELKKGLSLTASGMPTRWRTEPTSSTTRRSTSAPSSFGLEDTK